MKNSTKDPSLDFKHFVFCIVGVFACYSLYGVLQEVLFKQLPNFTYGWFLTLSQFLLYSVLIRMKQIFWDHSTKVPNQKPKAPIYKYAFVSFLSTSTIGLSNVSVEYLEYPVQVVFKSCKLIPVMITGRLFFGKQYGSGQIAAVLCLTFGLVIFSSVNISSSMSSTSSSLNPLGVFCISGALLADALIGQVQQQVMNRYQEPITELMLYSKLIGSAYLFIICIVLGQFFPGVAYCFQYPQAACYMLIFASVGCIGEFFVMEMVKVYGPLFAVTTTSLRKMFSICLSYALFPKPIHFSQIFGVLLVTIGIFLEVFSKNRDEIIRLIRQIYPHYLDPPHGEQQVLLREVEQVL